MTIAIQNTVLTHWRGKTNSKGWISGNAVCCTHNGETQDKRGRGGFKIDPDGSIAYSCFNCGFKTIYKPGYVLSARFRKLLHWMNVDEGVIQRLAIESLRERERQELLGLIKPVEEKEELKVSFKKQPLPAGATSFMGMVEFYDLKDSHDYPIEFVKAVEYIDHRKINMQEYDFYWTPNVRNKMGRRVIIPMSWKGKTIGYTARAYVDGIEPKYINHFDNGYVFNVDKQAYNWQFVVVCEGIFDAMSIDGVAIMKSEPTKLQEDIIESLDREVIVVPDFDRSGGRLIDAALKNHWSVSFPVWAETCKDINEAVIKYGKLFVLHSILRAKETSSLRIKLLRKKFR